MDQYEKLQQVLEDLQDDFKKFYKKRNKAAGTRIRKGMQELKVLAQEIRLDVQRMKAEQDFGSHF